MRNTVRIILSVFFGTKNERGTITRGDYFAVFRKNDNGVAPLQILECRANGLSKSHLKGSP